MWMNSAIQQVGENFSKFSLSFPQAVENVENLGDTA
jgi:hypothetical protein